LAFEKEKKMNNLVIVMGVISSAAGLAVYFMTAHKATGILILIVGVSLLVISLTISNIFFRIRMAELLGENRKK
jgi:uncharacterized membrane protein HdeD (DUF308 family)